MKIEKNAVSSKWIDLVELVRAQDLDVTNKEGATASEEFLEAFDNHKKQATREASGISMRWMLGTYEDEEAIYLIAQVLPCSLDTIEASPALKSDHARGMMAGKFPVQYDSFNGDTAAGKNTCRQYIKNCPV